MRALCVLGGVADTSMRGLCVLGGDDAEQFLDIVLLQPSSACTVYTSLKISPQKCTPDILTVTRAPVMIKDFKIMATGYYFQSL